MRSSDLTDSSKNKNALVLSMIIGLTVAGVMYTWHSPVSKAFNYELFQLAGTSITVYVLFFTLIVTGTIVWSWISGGRTACLISAITWNFEILTYNIYKYKWGYSVEHISLLALLFLFWESPADKRERHRIEAERERIEAERERIEAEKKASEKDAENAELQRLTLVFKKMLGEVNSMVSSQKQKLQEVDFTWHDLISKIISTERHDLLNRLDPAELNEIEKKAYEKVIVPFKDVVLESLNCLPEKLDIECRPIDIGVLVDEIKSKLPENFYQSTYEFVVNDNVPCDMSRCKVSMNVNRINSVIYNILHNSSAALSHRDDELYLDGKEFNGELSLNFNVVDGQFIIHIVDNAGGFPDSIVTQIYRKPVASSKPSRGGCPGEGTEYSAFFVKYMGGEIVASNVVKSPDLIGASTTIQFPVLTWRSDGSPF
jgi:signal transduction histidine kinase